MSNTLPTLKKNWNIISNQPAASSESGLTANQKTLWFIKEAFVNLPMPWTVIASSNSVAYTGDGTPHFGDYIDQSGNSITLFPTSMAVGSITSDVPGGVFSTNSTVFASGDYIRSLFSTDLNFEYTDVFSISLWFKTSGAGTYVLAGKANISTVGYEIVMTSGVLTFELINNVTTNRMRVDTSGGWNDNAWHHIVATWDGNVAGGASGANVYIDGNAESLSVINNTLSASIKNTVGFQISGRNLSTLTFVGSIDDVAVYNRELSASEAFDIYNSGAPTDLRLYGGDDNLLDGYLAGYWLMGEDVILTDAADYWQTYADLIWALSPTAHSWIVLQHPVNNTQFLINCEGSGGSSYIFLTFSVSFSGSFSGGTLGNEPTAPDQIELNNGSISWIWLNAGTFSSWINSWQSDDGLCNRVMANTNSGAKGIAVSLFFDEIDSFASGFENKEIAMVSVNDGGSALDIQTMSLVNDYSNTSNFRNASISAGFPGCVGPTKIPDSNNWGMGSVILNHKSSAENEYMLIGNVAILDFTHITPFSGSIWFRAYTHPLQDRWLFGKSSGTSPFPGWKIGLSSTNKIYLILANNSTTNYIRVDTNSTYTDANWHHLAFSYDGSGSALGVTIYIDGQVAPTTIVSNTLSATIANTGRYEIGSLGNGSACFVGNLTENAIFNIEIDGYQVAELYQDGYIDDIRKTSLDGYLVGYWPLNGSDTYPTAQDLINGNNATATNMENFDYPFGDNPNNPLIYFKFGCYGNAVTNQNFITSMAATAVANELDSTASYPAIPIGMFSDYGYRGFYGFLPDLWWGPDTIADTSPGDTFPNDPNNRLFAQYSSMIFPWTGDSTIPKMGGSAPLNNTYDIHNIEDTFAATGSQTKYYQMTGIDTGNPSQPSYHSWVVSGNPDPTGAQAVGPYAPPFGGPLTNIIISSQWTS